jgi:membrane protein implicated in regulation of membrane protease activity
MEIILNPTAWIIAALVLMAAEFIVPGGIIFFLGAGCLIVAGALWLGLVTTWVNTLTLFFITSLALILSLRSFFTRFAGGDYSQANTEEIIDDLDEIAVVLEPIGPGENVGTINFRGSTWRALGNGQKIATGAKVRIVARDNITYIVEPAQEIETN